MSGCSPGGIFPSVPALLAAVERRYPNLRSVAAEPVAETVLLEAMLARGLVLMGEAHCQTLTERNEQRVLRVLHPLGLARTPEHPLDLGSEYTILEGIEPEYPLLRRFFLPLPVPHRPGVHWIIQANAVWAGLLARFLEEHRDGGVSPVIPIIVGLYHIDSHHHGIQRYLLERGIECLVLRFDEEYARTGLFRHSPCLFTVGGRYELKFEP